MKEKIIQLSNKYEEYVIDMRRKIHANPELAFKEYETSKLIEEELIKMGLEVNHITETGVIGLLDCGKGKISEKKVILLRADIDALPLEEKNKVSYKSKNPGIMHACGHDVHTANLLGVANILKDIKDQLNGVFKFVFQPAEESGGGGRLLVENGVLENPRVDMCLAMHVSPTEEGKITIGEGNISANSDGFIIEVLGRKAHTSRPQEGVDAINIAGQILNALNSIISRKIDPLENVGTYSIGRIEGGTAANIIADKVTMEGMMRTLDFDSRDIILKDIKSISKGIAQSFGGDINFELIEGYPSIVNDPELVSSVERILKDNIDLIASGIFEADREKVFTKDADPMMASEDFGYYSLRVPSVYLRIGTGNFVPPHNSEFNVNENYIKYMTRMMAILAISHL